jgi:hypothetical protein
MRFDGPSITSRTAPDLRVMEMRLRGLRRARPDELPTLAVHLDQPPVVSDGRSGMASYLTPEGTRGRLW